MQRHRRTLKGYTFVELVVAIAMFSIIMLAVMQVFATTFLGYKETKKLQRNLETAQFAINTMAKELRTSSVLSGSSSPLNIRFIDYSQNGGRGTCILYQVNSGQLEKWARDMGNSDPNVNRTDCRDSVSFGAGDHRGILVKSIQASRASVVPSRDSGPKRVGKVTISLKVGPEGYNETLQTTVSLRDFNYVGI